MAAMPSIMPLVEPLKLEIRMCSASQRKALAAPSTANILHTAWIANMAAMPIMLAAEKLVRIHIPTPAPTSTAAMQSTTHMAAMPLSIICIMEHMAFITPTEAMPGGDSEPDGLADGGHWISGSIKNPGSLRASLHVQEGEKIPAKKLAKAAHSSNPTTRRRANLAKTLKGFHH